jgi:hypothetical protein
MVQVEDVDDVGARVSYDAFVSYSSRDVKHVTDLVRSLAKKWGLRIWRDRESLKPGDRVRSEIENALQATRCCIVCVGKGPLKKFFEDEVRIAQELALSGACTLVPVLLPGCSMEDLPLGLKDFHSVDLNGDWPKVIEPLAKRIIELRPRRPDTVPSEDDIEKKLRRLSDLWREGLITQEVHATFMQALVSELLQFELRPMTGRD